MWAGWRAPGSAFGTESGPDFGADGETSLSVMTVSGAFRAQLSC